MGTIPVYFGDKIKAARKAAKLTQQQLAEKINVTNTSISNWENNTSRPDPDTIQHLCWALNVEPNYFFSQEIQEKCTFDTDRTTEDKYAVVAETASLAVITEAKKALQGCLEIDPQMRSPKRIMIMMEACPMQVDEILNMLEIDAKEFYAWNDCGVFPARNTVSKFLRFFKMSSTELLTEADHMELLKRSAETKYFDPKLVRRQNKIKIASRDGSYEERVLSDDQMAAIKAMLNIMPDASEDL